MVFDHRLPNRGTLVITWFEWRPRRFCRTSLHSKRQETLALLKILALGTQGGGGW